MRHACQFAVRLNDDPAVLTRFIASIIASGSRIVSCRTVLDPHGTVLFLTARSMPKRKNQVMRGPVFQLSLVNQTRHKNRPLTKFIARSSHFE
jgi:hypothetical protein